MSTYQPVPTPPVSALRQFRTALLAGVSFTIIAGVTPVWAQGMSIPDPVYYWTGNSGDGSWFNGGNWNPGAPTSGVAKDSVAINTGTAAVTQAGAKTNSELYIAYWGTDTGTLTVSGAGTLTGATSIDVGYRGTGVLNVSNGGKVSAASMTAGRYGNGTGTITVRGSGSAIELTGMLGATRGLVSVTEGGRITVGGNFTSQYADMLFDGAGSSVVVNGYLNVGQSPAGTEGSTLTLSNGASLNVRGALYLGTTQAGPSSSRGTLVIGAAMGEAAAAAGTLSVGGDIYMSDFGTWDGGPIPGTETAIVFNHTGTAASPFSLSAPITNGAGYQYNAALGYAEASGSAAINQVAGVTHLSGNSLAFTGITNVTGGTLLLSTAGSQLGGNFKVSGTGVLGGIGAIGIQQWDNGQGAVYGATKGTIASGGTLSPGLSGQIGTLTVNGNLAFDSGSTYAVDIAADKTSDLTNVGGTVTIASGARLKVTALGGQGDYGVDYSGAGHTYTVLTASGGLSGTFTDIQDSAFLTYTSSSDASKAYVKVALKGETPTEAPTEPPATYRWTGASGDDWSTAANWDHGVPPTTPTTLPNGTSIVVYVDNGTSVIRTPGAAVGNTLRLGYASGNQAALSVINGGTFNSRTIIVGEAGTAALSVNGAGSSLAAAANIVLGNASGGVGTMTVTGGGKVSSTQIVGVGYAAGATGTATVTGADSTLSARFIRAGHNGGSGTVTVANGGTLVADAALVLAQQTGGTAALNIGAAEGTAAVAAGNIQSPTIDFGAGTAKLVLNHTDTDYTLASVLTSDTGTASIRQRAGTTTLSGASGAFRGTTNVAGGALYVSNALGGTFNVTGGLLGGTGTIGNAGSLTTIASGGTLSAGSSDQIGTLTVAGDLTFGAGSTYAVRIAGDKTSDLTNVAGTATIASGARLRVSALGGQGDYGVDYSGAGHTYTVLTATGGLSGTFTDIQNSAFLTYTSSSDANNAYVKVALRGNDPTDPPTEAPTQPPAPAATHTWTGAVSNDWSNAANWDNGLPPTTYTTLPDGTVVVAYIDNGDVLVGNGGARIGTALRLGDVAGDRASLTVNGGGILSSSTLAVGGAGSGALTVTGAGSAINAGGNIFLGSASGGSGSLTVANGGTATTGQTVGIGYAAGASGTGLVTGANSKVSGRVVRVGYYGGTGTLTIANGGTVSASNYLSVGEMGNGSGTVNIGAAEGQAAAAAGSIETGRIIFGTGAGTLVFNHTNTDYTLASELSSDGGVANIRQVAGSTTLSGASGAFPGITTVSGGALYVTGSLGGVFNVTGGSLGGTGTIGTAGSLTTIASGGTLSPGLAGQVGTLNVAGDLVFDAGSTYGVTIAGNKTADLTTVAGTATIADGAKLKVTALGGRGDYGVDYTGAGHDYTILTAAGGLTGTFSDVQDTAFLAYKSSSDANNAYVNVSLKAEAPTEAPTQAPTDAPTQAPSAGMFEQVASGGNQASTARALDSLSQGSALWWAVANVGTYDDAREAYEQLSGAQHASVQNALVNGSHNIANAVNNRVRSTSSGVGTSSAASSAVMGYAAPVRTGADEAFVNSGNIPSEKPLSFWISAFGSRGTQNAGPSVEELNRTTGGLVIGADALVADGWRVGALAGYSRTGFDTASSDGGANSYHLGLYSGAELGDLAVRGGLSYTWNDISTNRFVGFLGERLSAQYAGIALQGFGELAYMLDAGPVALEPYANLTHVRQNTDTFTETGGIGALIVNGQVVNSTYTTLGLRAQTALPLGEVQAVLRGDAGWRHTFGDTATSTTHSFVAGGDSFTVAGAPMAADVAVFEAGLDLNLTPSAMLGLTYAGQFSADGNENGLSAAFKVKF